MLASEPSTSRSNPIIEVSGSRWERPVRTGAVGRIAKLDKSICRAARGQSPAGKKAENTGQIIDSICSRRRVQDKLKTPQQGRSPFS
jgi:hypothetical protein